MWYPPWFDSFESWMLSAVCGIAISCLFVLVRIYDSLRRIEKRLNERAKRSRKQKVDQDTKDGKEDV